MQCWLDLISDFIYLFFYTFLVEWENCVFPRFFARPVITTSTSGSFQPPQELLELQEESSLRTMLCKMWPNWEFTMEPLTSHFGTWSKWKHWHALYCLQSSEKKIHPQPKALWQLFDSPDDFLQMLWSWSRWETDPTERHRLGLSTASLLFPDHIKW